VRNASGVGLLLVMTTSPGGTSDLPPFQVPADSIPRVSLGAYLAGPPDQTGVADIYLMDAACRRTALLHVPAPGFYWLDISSPSNAVLRSATSQDLAPLPSLEAVAERCPPVPASGASFPP
jgi:hypothetical protein